MEEIRVAVSELERHMNGLQAAYESTPLLPAAATNIATHFENVKRSAGFLVETAMRVVDRPPLHGDVEELRQRNIAPLAENAQMKLKLDGAATELAPVEPTEIKDGNIVQQ